MAPTRRAVDGIEKCWDDMKFSTKEKLTQNRKAIGEGRNIATEK